MWSASVSALLVLFACAGCERRLDLQIALAADSCTTSIPAGGSLLYEVSAGSSDGGARAFCGGCLLVTRQLDGTDAIVGFLRQAAPECAGVRPGSSLVVRLTAWNAGACPEAPAPRLFCSESQPVALPDGRSDAVAVAVLTCSLGCTAACKPSSCIALGKNCDTISDGCGGMLVCGDCKPPEKCGGTGIANVCGK
jgi:hypothetical protein